MFWEKRISIDTSTYFGIVKRGNLYVRDLKFEEIAGAQKITSSTFNLCHWTSASLIDNSLAFISRSKLLAFFIMTDYPRTLSSRSQ